MSKRVSSSPEPPEGNIFDQPERLFQAPKRVTRNILARPERYLLNNLCQVMPAWVTPDHLTALGVIGAFIAAAGYVASNLHPGFFFLASFGLVVNWFGDSLDGSLARYRKIERPRYGYFVDHSVDAFSNLVILVGLGFSPYVGMGVALFALAAYLCLTLYVFLLHQVTGEFRLSFLNCGPTEARLVVIWFNFVMYALGPFELPVFGHGVPLHAASVGLSGAALVAVFTANVYKTARELARQNECPRAAESKPIRDGISTAANKDKEVSAAARYAT